MVHRFIRPWAAAAITALCIGAGGTAYAGGGLFGQVGKLLGGGDSQGEPSDQGGPALDIGKLLKHAQQAFGETSPEEEVAVGDQAAAVLLGAVPLVQDAALERYVNRVGRWVALHTERPDLEWRFGVLDTDDVNAFAAPGGIVLVTKGLLRHLRDEAELAGVLAHECAHVLRHHHLRALRKNARLGLALDVVGSGADAERRGQLERIANGFKELYARGLDKEDEFEADRLGEVIAARAGYDPYGLVGAIQTLAQGDPNRGPLAFWFQTHPAPEQRLVRLDATFDTLQPYAGQPDLRERFVQATASLRQK